MGKLLMKMAVLLQGHAFCAWTAMDPSGYFFFEKPSLIDFQIGTGRKREFRAAELRFSLHKEFCAAEIRFYLHKEHVGAVNADSLSTFECSARGAYSFMIAESFSIDASEIVFIVNGSIHRATTATAANQSSNAR